MKITGSHGHVISLHVARPLLCLVTLAVLPRRLLHKVPELPPGVSASYFLRLASHIVNLSLSCSNVSPPISSL